MTMSFFEITIYTWFRYLAKLLDKYTFRFYLAVYTKLIVANVLLNKMILYINYFVWFSIVIFVIKLFF